MARKAVNLCVFLTATTLVLYLMYNDSCMKGCQNQTGADTKHFECVAVDTRMRIPNTLRTQYDSFASEKLSSLSARNATSEDGEVIELVRYLLDRPSRHMRKVPLKVRPSPQAAVIDELFGDKKGGFFVEAGAFDGETHSNTLFLEQHRQWTGLLVETDPYFYTQLIGKSRSSWSINAALSTVSHVTEMSYEESYSQFGKLAPLKTNSAMKLPCFPLYAMLLALNRTTVDFFSLDIEGLEFEVPGYFYGKIKIKVQVLKTLPLNIVKFGAISVEYLNSPHSKQEFVDFMADNGYTVHMDLVFRRKIPYAFAHDFIFIPKLQ